MAINHTKTDIETLEELFGPVKSLTYKSTTDETNHITSQNHFQVCPDSGLSIGYHVEEVEDCSQEELTVDKLNPNRPFFISNDPDSWWPDHLNKDIEEGKFRCYKILFKPSNYVVFKAKGFEKHFDSIYFRLFETSGEVRLNRETMWMVDNCKVNLFILHSSSELFEAFLVNSNTVVKKIENYVKTNTGKHYV